jgi:hypothetical protein
MAVALGQTTALVDATVSRVASGLEVEPQPDNGNAKACEKDNSANLVYASYGTEVHLSDDGSELFDAAVAFWKGEGYDVVVRDPRSNAPSAYLNFGDFSFELYVNSLSKLAFIGGSTPCYPPPS